MRAVRFGDDYTTAYTFSDVNSEEDWAASRPPVQQPVGGAGGAFDFYGSEDYPITPLAIEKKFTIVSNSYSDVGGDLDSLREVLFGGLSKLWFWPRNGTASYDARWAWAKCTSFRSNERSQASKNTVDVELRFNCPEGIFYEALLQTRQESSNGNYSLGNWGNYPALVNLSVEADSDAVTKVEVVNNSNGISFTWDPDGATSIAIGKSLEVDSRAYSVTDSDGNDHYRYCTLEDGQMAFIVLSGIDSITLTVTPNNASIATFGHYSSHIF